MSYVYDEDGTLIADTLTGGATTSWGQSARYIYLPTASGPMPVAAIYGTKHYAIQSDHLNTPRRLIQSDGQVAWQWAYSAFGEEKPTTAKTRFANADLNQSFGTTTVPAVTFNLRYPGQYFDQESSLHYNLNRSYCPNCGRYTQSDPIDLQGGWNRFSYVGQNPLSFTDPEGLAALGSTAGGFIGGWGGGAVGAALGGPPGAVAGRWVGGKLGSFAGSAIEDFCKSDDPDPCGPDLRETAKLKAYAWAGIPPDGGDCESIPWDTFNNKKSKGYAQAKQSCDAARGYQKLNGRPLVEDHPGGHNDNDAPHHKCSHFHATNVLGQKAIFPYKLK